MGKILEEAKFYADHYLPDIQQTGMADNFLRPFRTIESEIGQLYEMLAQRTKRIEALEEQVKHTEDKFDLVLRQHLEHLEIKEDVPTDRYGKPEGGLEPGDWLIVIDQWKRKWFVIYHHREGKKIYGYFMCIEGNETDWRTKNDPRDARLSKEISWFDEDKDRVIFEFHPQFPDRKER